MIYISNALWAAETYAPYAKINNPLVFYRSFLRPEDIIATTYNPDRPSVNMWNPDTASVWEGLEVVGSPSASTTQYIVLGNPTLAGIDYVAIAGHNFGNQLWSVAIDASTDSGATWGEIANTLGPVTSNEPIVFFFNAQSSISIFRIRMAKNLTGTISPPVIAHLKMGIATPLYRRIFSGFEPSLMKKSKTIQNGSDSGQYLGQVVIRSYRETSDIEQKNQPYSFVRGTIIPFLRHCSGEPFFVDTAASTFLIAWRPQKHPSELVYGWATDIKYPTNEQGNSEGGYMSWGISVGAIA